MSSKDTNTFEYDVALSFAGEDRQHAEALASLLTSRGIGVFYDFYEQANLWGKDLYEHLADIYTNKARYCVMFLSAHYARKTWTNHERQNAQARAFREHNEYILPVKLDDTIIPGIRPTQGYIDLRHQKIEEVANLLQQKLNGEKGGETKTIPEPVKVDSPQFHIPLPPIKRSFSQLEQDRFLKAAFSVIRQYFEQALKQIETHYPDVATDLSEVGPQKFFCKIYVGGSLKSQCKIWIGTLLSRESIHYVEGSMNMNNDNTYNEAISVVTHDNRLGLNLSMFGNTYHTVSTAEGATPEQAAEYLWRNFTVALK